MCCGGLVMSGFWAMVVDVDGIALRAYLASGKSMLVDDAS